MFRGEIRKKSNLDIKTHYKATETFQSTHLASCHQSGVKHGFIKGKAIRLLRTNSPKEILEEGLLKFKQRFKTGGYLENIIERSLSGVNFASRQLALTHTQKPKGHNVHSAVKDLKQISMEHRSQPLLIAIFTKPPIISNTKRKSRLWEENFNLKVTMQRDHKSHMESPCQSVLTFILGLRKPRVTWFGRYLVMRKW